MQRDRFEYLCAQAEAGNDAFVRHPSSNEEGMVTSCIIKANHFLVETPQGETRCWDFQSCEDLPRPKIGPMV